MHVGVANLTSTLTNGLLYVPDRVHMLHTHATLLRSRTSRPSRAPPSRPPSATSPMAPVRRARPARIGHGRRARRHTPWLISTKTTVRNEIHHKLEPKETPMV